VGDNLPKEQPTGVLRRTQPIGAPIISGTGEQQCPLKSTLCRIVGKTHTAKPGLFTV
jgi:hypothetical protein